MFFKKRKKEETSQETAKKVREINPSIVNVMKATGWSEGETRAKMEDARKKGVSYKRYARMHAYDLSESELVQLGETYAERTIKKEQQREELLNILCEKNGWSRQRAEEEFQKARDCGINIVKYIRKACYKMPEEKFEEVCLRESADKDRVARNKQRYVSEICKATGWSQGKVHLEVLKAKTAYGFSYEDYYAFKLYEVPFEEQGEYVSYDSANMLRIKYNYEPDANKYMHNKANFNETFADLIKRKWFVNTELTYEEFLEKTEGVKDIFIKPLASTQGIGTLKRKCDVSDEEKRKLYDEIMQMDESIIEEYIIQHDDVMKFCPTSVNTLRIVTLYYKGECKYLYSVFRMGMGEIVDNFHAGGIAASVDVETGEVYTDAVDINGKLYSIHPYSNLPIKGFKIPNWDKIKEISEAATGRVEGVNLVGWDFAITPDGADLIEGNAGASYMAVQISNVPLKKGLRKQIIDPYL